MTQQATTKGANTKKTAAAPPAVAAAPAAAPATGGVETYNTKGTPPPAGWVIDAEGAASKAVGFWVRKKDEVLVCKSLGLHPGAARSTLLAKVYIVELLAPARITQQVKGPDGKPLTAPNKDGEVKKVTRELIAAAGETILVQASQKIEAKLALGPKYRLYIKALEKVPTKKGNKMWTYLLYSDVFIPPEALAAATVTAPAGETDDPENDAPHDALEEALSGVG